MAWERADKFDAPLCASEACHQMGVPSVWRFERGGIGSYYCNECRSRIDVNRQRFDERERDYLEPTGYLRGDKPNKGE